MGPRPKARSSAHPPRPPPKDPLPHRTTWLGYKRSSAVRRNPNQSFSGEKIHPTRGSSSSLYPLLCPGSQPPIMGGENLHHTGADGAPTSGEPSCFNSGRKISTWSSVCLNHTSEQTVAAAPCVCVCVFPAQKAVCHCWCRASIPHVCSGAQNRGGKRSISLRRECEFVLDFVIWVFQV